MRDGRRKRRGGPRVALGLVIGVGLVIAVVLITSSGPAHRTPGGRGRPAASSSSSTGSSEAGRSTPAPSETATSSRTPALAPAQPAPADEQFGASVNLLFFSTTMPPQQLTAQLQALRATGVTVARSDALWEASEPTAPVHGAHAYTWAFDDKAAADLAARHLRWQPILDYAAPWAQSAPGQLHSPPRSAAEYAAYAGAFAARYGPGGTFWREHPHLPAEPVQTYEIWNEPDVGVFWSGAPQPGRYADLYLAARTAIDAAQPGARVIVGGLTQPTSFIPQLLAARPELRGHVDGVAIHPYGTPLMVLDKIRAARATLVSVGLGSVALYVTEFGWTTSPPGAQDYAAPAQRPDYVGRTLAALGHLDCGLAAAIIYTWFSPRQDPTNSEEWFGLDSSTGAATPDTAAFAQGLRQARASGPQIRVCGT